MWYDGIFSCGHEGRVNIIGPGKQREYKKEKAFSGICPECYKIYLENKRNEENELARRRAKEMELPHLEGTEKQIAWACTLRNKFIENMEKCMEEMFELKRIYQGLFDCGLIEKMDRKSFEGLMHDLLQYALKDKTSASYWIDTRDDNINIETMKKLLKEFWAEEEKNKIEELTPEGIENEMIVVPEKQIFSGMVEIKEGDNEIKLSYIKDNTFRETVKEKGYRWENGYWRRSLNTTTGSYHDRAAEIGNVLLKKGFAIKTANEYARQHAVDGNYIPEHKNWIMWNLKKQKYCIIWPKTEDREIYDKAKRIPTARYENGRIYVEMEYYKEILDFAYVYGFKFTQKAESILETYQQEINRIERVNPKEGNKPEEINRLKELLKKDGAILTDLMDE